MGPQWLHMASLDIDSLFANKPLDVTINISIDNLHNGNGNPSNISKHDFRHLLNIFYFYQQIL